MNKLKMQADGLRQKNLAALRRLFPHCFIETTDGAEGKLQFDLLKNDLSDILAADDNLGYQLAWPGKNAALFAANTGTTQTLRPSPADSRNHDHTRNLFIEGDNLEALKIMRESYLGKIKLAYIDPPYNTGNDFVYNDKFARENSFDHLVKIGAVNQEGQVINHDLFALNRRDSGRFHSTWLSMITPRLKLARTFLRDDGVIAVHIDENEYANMEKILGEIFGVDNNLGTIVWDKRNPKGKVGGISQQHEYIILFARDREEFLHLGGELARPKANAPRMLKKAQTLIKKGGVTEAVRAEYKKWVQENRHKFSGGESAYMHLDANGDIYQSVSMAASYNPEIRSYRPFTHPKTGKHCPVPENGWANTDQNLDDLLKNDMIVFGEDETTQPRRKYLLRDYMTEIIPSLLYHGGTGKARGLPFDHPKPDAVAKQLIETLCKARDDIVLDFFAGSATAADAVLQLNAADGLNRRFIMIQLPELCNEKSDAHKLGYKTIAELGRKRIRMAGEAILAQNALHPQWDKDIGFRALRVDSSNMKDVYYTPDELRQAMLINTVDNIKPDRGPEDLLIQIMLTFGMELTLPIRAETIGDKSLYWVNGADLAACFDGGLDEEFFKTLAKTKPARAVFRDNSFADDGVLVNAEQIFLQLSPATELHIL